VSPLDGQSWGRQQEGGWGGGGGGGGGWGGVRAIAETAPLSPQSSQYFRKQTEKIRFSGEKQKSLIPPKIKNPANAAARREKKEPEFPGRKKGIPLPSSPAQKTTPKEAPKKARRRGALGPIPLTKK